MQLPGLLEKTKAASWLLYDTGRCIAFIEANPEEYLSFGQWAVPAFFAAAVARAEKELAGRPADPDVARRYREMLNNLAGVLYQSAHQGPVCTRAYKLLTGLHPKGAKEAFLSACMTARASMYAADRASLQLGLQTLDELIEGRPGGQVPPEEVARVHLLKGDVLLAMRRPVEARAAVDAARAMARMLNQPALLKAVERSDETARSPYWVGTDGNK